MGGLITGVIGLGIKNLTLSRLLSIPYAIYYVTTFCINSIKKKKKTKRAQNYSESLRSEYNLPSGSIKKHTIKSMILVKNKTFT